MGDTSESGSGSDSDSSNLSPDDPIFEGCRDSDVTHDWNPEVKMQLRSHRVSHQFIKVRFKVRTSCRKC